MNVDFLQPGSIHGDEYYTLLADAETIADHLIKQPLKVWCPFNDVNSVWANVLSERRSAGQRFDFYQRQKEARKCVTTSCLSRPAF